MNIKKGLIGLAVFFVLFWAIYTFLLFLPNWLFIVLLGAYVFWWHSRPETKSEEDIVHHIED